MSMTALRPRHRPVIYTAVISAVISAATTQVVNSMIAMGAAVYSRMASVSVTPLEAAPHTRKE